MKKRHSNVNGAGYTGWMLSAAIAVLIHAGLTTPAAADQILETYSDSLTSYPLTSKTYVQDTRPLVIQRGVNLDGSARNSAGLPVMLAGNASEPGAGGGDQMAGIWLATGTPVINDTDMVLPAPGFSWVIGRSYNSRQKDSGGSYFDSGSFQGKNWFQSSAPEIRLYDDANNAKDEVYLVYGADRFAEFVRKNSSSNQFKGRNGVNAVFEFAAGPSTEPDTYTLTAQNGTQMVFFGFDNDSGVAKGQLWKIIDSNSNTAFVGDATTGSTAISNGFDGSGRILKAYDSADRRYTYTYTSNRLTQVLAETKASGTWSSPSGVVTVATVDYAYYTADADTYGDAGDLKLVTITTPLTDSGVNLVRKKYYRYWENGYNVSSNPGYPHQIQYIVDFEGTRNYSWTADSDMSTDDFITATESNLKPYASAYFEYNSDHRVRKSWANGACGCGGGASNGLFQFEYEDNNQYSDSAGYDNAEAEWATRTTITKPDSSFVTRYFDEVGQSLHSVTTAADPDTNPGSKWCTRVLRNADGQVTEIDTSENVTAYTHTIGGSWGFTTSSSVGLIATFNRETTGDTTGFVLDVKHKTGSSGSAYLDRTLTYTTRGLVVTDVTLSRPLVASSRVYSAEQTSGTGNSYLTSYSYDWHSSTNTNVLYITTKSVTTTLPVVSTGTNGSNSSNTTVVYLRKDGTTVFTQAPDGIFTFTQFTKGQLTKRIDDVVTNGSFPSGDDPNTNFGITETGDGLGITTEFAYDAQGRLSQTTKNAQAGGGSQRKPKVYYSRLKDHRIVTLQFTDSDATPTYYGPVSYTVSNQAGKAEVQGIIKLTNNSSVTALGSWIDETDADAITAVDEGTIARISSSVYNQSGAQMQESRAYTTIPGSLPGSSGTNYDPTKFGYDDSGRQWRVKDPTGTITRTVFDSIGRVSASYLGSNDYTFSGGEAVSADDMVKVNELVYDAAGVGNSRVTKQTGFIQNNTTGKREVSNLYDTRGRLIVQVNPVAPHVLNKYDNMGRLIASAQYSSSSGLDATDDPTSLDTNRLGLSQSFYDEMGRVWKSQRHKIDDADGSDDDNLQTLTWYDADGHVIKVDGSQLTKTAYDRLGRAVHQYTLAVDNDSVYTDADDVAGDVVLSQNDTTYDPDTGDVLMTARIDRFHDDYGGGQTTGVMDSNADTDDLKYTAANLKGRIQITAMWYDQFDRPTDTVSYGTYNGADFDRDGLGVPSRSDTALRTTTTYNTDGTVLQVEDPRGLKTRYVYDDAGRQITLINNYVNGTPSGATGADDVITRFVYTNGLKTKMWVDLDGDNVKDADDQETIYTYGVIKGTNAGDSLYASGRLLFKVQYPDSSGGSDVVSFGYNAQGQQVWMKDQSGNVTETTFDDGGRFTHKKVTTLISGFDGAVLRISYVYDGLGRTSTVTQYDNATPGSGSVVNEVKYTYDDWGLVSAFEQDRDSAVAGGGNQYTVSYTYAKVTAGRNTLVPATMVLPGSTTVTYDLRSANDNDTYAARIPTVKVGATTVAEYQYNGVSQAVAINYPQASVMSNEFAGGGSYPDLDRFNRVSTSRWTKDLGTDRDFYKVDLTYDRDSNITVADESVHGGFDALYTMDDLNRLIEASEGTYSTGSISPATRLQTWKHSSAGMLDQVGNWTRVKLNLNAGSDSDYSDTGEYDDTRTHNTGNELTARDTDSTPGTTGNNFTLTYDAVGNLTDDAESYGYVYDAFGRLRKVYLHGGTAKLFAEYTYNGLGYRIGVHEDTDSSTDVDGSDLWYYSAYDTSWRNVATFRGSDSSPKEQFVYHASSSSRLDDLILRDRDMTNGWTGAADGVLEQRHYFCQNWHGDVVAIVTSGGAQVEQDRYSAYGIAFGMAAGDVDSDGDVDAADATQIQTWINGTAYDVRGDLDLDGDVDATDKTTCQANAGNNLGWGALTLAAIGNRKGYAGYEHDVNLAELYHVRHRVLNITLGSWMKRDSLQDIDGNNLYAYAAVKPIGTVDSSGLACLGLQCPPILAPVILDLFAPNRQCSVMVQEMLIDPEIALLRILIASKCQHLPAFPNPIPPILCSLNPVQSGQPQGPPICKCQGSAMCYDPVKHQICIPCTGHGSFVTPTLTTDFRKNIIHELTHAWQNCDYYTNGKCLPSDPGVDFAFGAKEMTICQELGARCRSGQCDPTKPEQCCSGLCNDPVYGYLPIETCLQKCLTNFDTCSTWYAPYPKGNGGDKITTAGLSSCGKGDPSREPVWATNGASSKW